MRDGAGKPRGRSCDAILRSRLETKGRLEDVRIVLMEILGRGDSKYQRLRVSARSHACHLWLMIPRST